MSSRATADFVHLHTHSHYSLLEALPKIPELVAVAAKDGQTALALTDNGNLYGAIEFYKECKENSVKPIIGVDFHVAPRSRTQKEHRVDDQTSRIVLLAKNETGYHNLIQLVSIAHIEGFYYRPRIDRELIERFREGLIAILPSYGGEHAHAIRHGSAARAEETMHWHKKIFGIPPAGGCYVEITRHPEIDGHDAQMRDIIARAESVGLPVVAAHDIYYLSPEDSLACDLVNKIRTGGALDRNTESAPRDFSFLPRSRMEELFGDLPEALAHSKDIAEKCNLELNLGSWVFPAFPIPEGSSGDRELRTLIERGFLERDLKKSAKAQERVDYELSVIAKKGYAPYFLVVADLLHHAREKGILTNTRGSVAGSLVSYLCGITTINPFEYQLPFERFLNPERPSPPDIDMDLADNRRDELIDYVRQKYGEDKVAQIGTFGTMMARAAVRDVARALGQPYGLGDTIAKLIPFGKQGFPVSIKSSLESVPELAQTYENDASSREILDLAQKIEGNARHVGVHAAGVVIAPTAVTDYVPIQHDPKGGKTITQYDMYAVEDAGLLKFDFLGLTNLSVLSDARARVSERIGTEVGLDRLPLDDEKTYKMLSRGETHGVFQLAGGGMTSYLTNLEPSTIHDINAMVALYRPGPMAFIPAYIERKKSPKLIRYLDPRMEPILKNSYGVIVYQDDVLEIAIKLAGYSWLEADKFRKAMGKKIPAEMRAQKEKFTGGCVRNGMKKESAQKLWEQIETFAAYGFNKCLTGDTRIADADTGALITIHTLIEKQETPLVHTLTDTLTLSSAVASRPFKNGIRQVYKLTTRSGRVIRATDNHPFRTFDGWTQLGALQPEMRIATPRHLPKPQKAKSLPFHRASALGYLLSEGNLCHPHGVYFYSTRNDEVHDFISAAQKFTNTRITIDRSKSAVSVYVGQINQKLGNSLREWMSDLGLVGKTATRKFVPEIMFGADNTSLAIFLGKLWQGDGCVSVKNQLLSYATSSRRLADDIQHLLLRFGIISTVHTKQFRYRGRLKTGWTVAIHGAENLSSFVATIGQHLIGSKKEMAHKVLVNSRTRTNNRGRGTVDTLPVEVFHLLYEERGSYDGTTKTLAQHAGVSQRLLFHDVRKRGYTRAVLARIANALQSKPLHMHASSDIFWDEVVSIEPDGKEMTYDLTVPAFSNFVANGLIVHNSHAASYGNLAYKTAYMKANFPVDYMAALLTADAGDVEKIAETVQECKRMGIKVLPPSVNESKGNFTVVDDTNIRFGLHSIKNFGRGVADAIITARESNPFKDIADFLSRVPDRNLNKKQLESLIQSGALDEIGERGNLLANIDLLLEYHREHMKTPTDQGSLFGKVGAPQAVLKLPDSSPATLEERLAWEKELLGLYVSGHPLDKHKAKFADPKKTIKHAKEHLRGVETVIAGFVEQSRINMTKNGERMGFLKIADFSDAIEVVAFPRTFKEYESLMAPGACIVIKGKISERNGEPSFVVERAKAL